MGTKQNVLNCVSLDLTTFNFFNKEYKLTTFHYCILPTTLLNIKNFKTYSFAFINCHFSPYEYFNIANIYSNLYINVNNSQCFQYDSHLNSKSFNSITTMLFSNHLFYDLNCKSAKYMFMLNTTIKNSLLLNSNIEVLYLRNCNIESNSYVISMSNLFIKYIILENMCITESILNIIKSIKHYNKKKKCKLYISNCINKEKIIPILKKNRTVKFIHYFPKFKLPYKALEYGYLQIKKMELNNRHFVTYDYIEEFDKYDFSLLE